LLNRKDDEGKTPLFRANEGVTKFLLAAGADVSETIEVRLLVVVWRNISTVEPWFPGQESGSDEFNAKMK
jgi:hypothetical protein